MQLLSLLRLFAHLYYYLSYGNRINHMMEPNSKNINKCLKLLASACFTAHGYQIQ